VHQVLRRTVGPLWVGLIGLRALPQALELVLPRGIVLQMVFDPPALLGVCIVQQVGQEFVSHVSHPCSE
jgi:hypothetical protein